VALHAGRVREVVRLLLAFNARLQRLITRFESLIPHITDAWGSFKSLAQLHEQVRHRGELTNLDDYLNLLSSALLAESKAEEYLKVGVISTEVLELKWQDHEEEVAASLILPTLQHLKSPPLCHMVAVHQLRRRFKQLK